MTENISERTSWGRYLATWIALVVLTVTSFAFSFADFGAADYVVAIVIAVVKSALVLEVFMHLREQQFTSAAVPVMAVFFVCLLLALVATDIGTRHTFPPRVSPDTAGPGY